MLGDDDWRAVDGRRRRDREALAGAGRRHLGTRRPALGALPARLRVRAARDRGGGRAAGSRRAAGTGSGRRPGGARWPTRSRPASPTACTRRGRWQRAPDDERVDAALLLPVIRGGFGLADPRNMATIEAVRDELGADGFVYRFRHDDRPLHKAEGAFLLCGFWMALVEHALRQPGRRRALVRAEPVGGRAGRAVHRGVRRAPAAAAREPAAGVRARGDARVRGDAVPRRPARRCGRLGRRPSGGSRQNGAGCADPDGEPRLPGGVVQGPDGGAVAGGDRPNLAEGPPSAPGHSRTSVSLRYAALQKNVCHDP